MNSHALPFPRGPQSRKSVRSRSAPRHGNWLTLPWQSVLHVHSLLGLSSSYRAFRASLPHWVPRPGSEPGAPWHQVAPLGNVCPQFVFLTTARGPKFRPTCVPLVVLGSSVFANGQRRGGTWGHLLKCPMHAEQRPHPHSVHCSNSFQRMPLLLEPAGQKPAPRLLLPACPRSSICAGQPLLLVVSSRAMHLQTRLCPHCRPVPSISQRYDTAPFQWPV